MICQMCESDLPRKHFGTSTRYYNGKRGNKSYVYIQRTCNFCVYKLRKAKGHMKYKPMPMVIP
jgi:hypothetical protein